VASPVEPGPDPESAPDLGSNSLPALGARRPSRGQFLGLDRPGCLQALGGIVIALIALLSSYDHVSLPADATLQIPQQWGVWFIVASMALVVADAQLATGSRNRERDRAAEERIRADRERVRAAEDRIRAAQERERAARRAQRQDRCNLVQLRHQLAPTPLHAEQVRNVIALLEEFGTIA